MSGRDNGSKFTRRDAVNRLRKLGAGLAAPMKPGPVGLEALGLSGAVAGGGQRRRAPVGSSYASSAGSPPPPFLLSIFLRGGMDGLTTLAPSNDTHYQAARDVTRVWDPADPMLPDPSVAGLPLTSGVSGMPDFFVPQVLAPLKTLFDEPNSKLAFIHASGSADSTRSHFEQQSQMESGTTGNAMAPLSSGWVGRHLATMPHTSGTGLFRALSYGSLLAQTLREGPGVTPVPNPENYMFPIDFPATPQEEAARQATLDFTYDKFGPPLDTAMQSVLESVGTVSGVNYGAYVPGGGAVYPGTEFGGQLRHIAQLAREVPTLEVAHVDIGGWDTHEAQGVHTPGGRMYELLKLLADGYYAFHRDMDASGRDFIAVICTEFGRTVNENASDGTDHGRGGVTIVGGTEVIGGQVYGTWPGLAPGQLDMGDLVVTTDIRDVFGEIASSALGNTNVNAVVPPEPGVYQYAPVGFLP